MSPLLGQEVENLEPWALWVGLENGAATAESSGGRQKIKNRNYHLSRQSGYVPIRTESRVSGGDLYPRGLSRITHNAE